MAQLSDINAKLEALISAALVAAGITTAQIGSQWPPSEVLQNAGAPGGAPIFAILEKFTNFQTRNMRLVHSVTTMPVGIASTASDFSIAPGQSVTITLGLAPGSSSVNVSDMVSCCLVNGDYNNAATAAAILGSTTLPLLAAALTTAINTAFTAVGVTATSTGPVITVTNAGSSGYHISSNVGNITQVAESSKWACSSMQVNAWCGDLNTKFAIRNALIGSSGLLVTLDDSDGFELDSGEWIELKLHGSKPDDADTDKDVYADMYFFTLDYMIDVIVNKYAVIATNPVVTNG